MSDSQNAADRLRGILAEAKDQPRNTVARTVWAKVLKSDAANLPKLYYELALLQELVSEVEERIRELDVDHAVYLQHFPAVRQIFAVSNFDAPWDSAKNQITEALLLSVQFCAERLHAHGAEPIIPADELEKIRQEIDSLFDEISASELNKPLRMALLDMLETMRRAIAEYRIRGARGLRQELFTVFGRLEQNFGLVRESNHEPEVSGFWKILSRYDTLTSMYLNLPQLTAGFQALLPGSSG